MTTKPGFSATRRFRRGRRSAEAGLSLLELLIAMALLAVIAVGILPMMMRSLADTHRGWEATEVSNFALSQIEDQLATPFDSPSLDVGSGLTENLSSRTWVEGDPDQVGDALEGWTDDPTSKGLLLWRRNTYVRWYNKADLSTPLDGDTEPTEVHLKEIQVQVTGERQGGALGGGQELWIRVFKAF